MSYSWYVLWYTVHSVVYTCDLILARIWLLDLCPFINRVLHCWRPWTRFGTHTSIVLPWGRWTKLLCRLHRSWVSRRSTSLFWGAGIWFFRHSAKKSTSACDLIAVLGLKLVSKAPSSTAHFEIRPVASRLWSISPNGKSVLTEILYSSKYCRSFLEVIRIP